MPSHHLGEFADNYYPGTGRLLSNNSLVVNIFWQLYFEILVERPSSASPFRLQPNNNPLPRLLSQGLFNAYPPL